ncbi:MAG: peptidylprolyl isomerase [Planctomycetaceae bacterium]|nr:peptidylprolyl isomerase [Planctomycetaceae bacterium]
MNLSQVWQRWLGASQRKSGRSKQQGWRSVRFEPLEQRQMLTVGFETLPLGTAFVAPQSKDVLIPLSTNNTNNTAVNYTVQSAPGNGVTATVENAGTTLKMNVSFTNASNQSVTGDIYFRLFDSLTPDTVDQIKSFVQSGYYNGLRIPRVLNGFVAQFGSSNNTLSDPSGPTPYDDEFNSSLTFTGPGLLAMANGGPDTNGRQLFITDVDVGVGSMPQTLNFDHTIIGQVVGGFNTFKQLMETPTQTSSFIPGEPSSPLNNVTINSFGVVSDNTHAVLRIHTDNSAETGSRSVTVRATSQGDNASVDQVFSLIVLADSINDEPFLPNLAETINTNAGLPITLTATDIDGDNVTFDVVSLFGSSTATATNVSYSASGNVLTITPNPGFTGTQRLRVSVRETGTSTVDDLEDFDLVVAPTPEVSLSVSPSNGLLTENGGAATVVATLSNASVQDVVVNISLAGTGTFNTDYSQTHLTNVGGTTASLVIPAGQIAAIFTLRGIQDALDEPNETIIVNATSATNANVSVSQSSVSAMILDDDFLISLNVLSTVIGENGGSAVVQITLSEAQSFPVTALLLTTGTATSNDYAVSPAGYISTIPAGTTLTQFTLSAVDDLLSEPTETIEYSLWPYFGIGTVNPAASTATVTVIDNDPRGVSLSVSNTLLSEVGGSAAIIATLTEPSVNDVTITLSTGGTAGVADYTRTPNTIVIPAGQVTGSLLVDAINDLLNEGNESIILNFASATEGFVAAQGGESVSLTIIDDDVPPQVSISASTTSFAERGGTITIVATSDKTSSVGMVVVLSLSGTANASDHSAFFPSIVIPAGQTSGSLTISGVDDFLREGDETIVIDVATVINGGENGTQQVTASIVDDAADPFELVDDRLNVFGTSGDDQISIDYGTATSSFTATVNGQSATFTAGQIVIDAAAGRDSLTVKLSSLADLGFVRGKIGTISSSVYDIRFSDVESSVFIGNGGFDMINFYDQGLTSTAYILPQYSILQTTGFFNQAIGFTSCTIEASGEDDNLFMYGDTTSQVCQIAPTFASIVSGSFNAKGVLFKRVYAYGMGGDDAVFLEGSSADETMTALPTYTLVTNPTNSYYFYQFKTVSITGGGGFDTALMYDSAGVDTFTASDTEFRYKRTGVFENVAVGYDRVYAFNYFGGRDTATLNGSSGNDRLTSLANYSVLVTPTTYQQVIGFHSVSVNAGGGNDTATLYDSIGVDTLNAFGNTAELVYANGRSVRASGFDTVTAFGTLSLLNRKTISTSNPLIYQLRLNGIWV